MTASCLYRGEVSGMEVDQSLNKLLKKNERSFTEWIPDNTMSSICKVSCASDLVPQNCISGTLLTNSTAIANSMISLTESFEKMLNRKAFIHNYQTEGMDEMEFREALYNVRDLIDEY